MSQSIALVHDNFAQMGGAERVAAALKGVLPDAEVHSTLAEHARLSPQLRSTPIHTTWMQRLPSPGRFYRHYFLFYPFAIEGMDLNRYDLIVTSCFGYAKGVRKREGALHVCYCHNPMRWVWRYEDYAGRETFNPVNRVVLPILLGLLKRWDLRASRRPDYFIANSKVVAERIKNFYGRDSVVIPPPIDTQRFKPSDIEEDHYLVLSRLAPYKRIDLAVQACNQLGRRLVVIGDGPDRKRLESLAGGTVQFMGRQPDDVVERYASTCRALLFTGEEDFGMAPLELNAAGRPVVSFRGGGALETQIEGLTGVFFDEPSPESLTGAILRLESQTWNREEIRKHAMSYDTAVFAERITGFLNSLPERPGTSPEPMGFIARKMESARTWAVRSGSMAAVLQSVATKLLVVGLNAATGIIVARVLLPEGRGQMAATIMWAGILSSMMTLGLPSALIYNLQLNRERPAEPVRTALWLALLLGFVTALAGWALVPLWLSSYPAEIRQAASWFLLSSPIPILLVVGRAALEGRKDFTGSNLTLWAAPGITLTALLALAATHRLTVITGGLAYVLAGVPVCIWLLIRVLRKTGIGAPTLRSARQLLHYGVRAYGIDLLTALATQADQVLVVGFLSPATMGTYVVATSLARILSVFQLSVAMVLFPRTAARGPEEVLAIVGRASRITTLLALAVAPLALLFGPGLMTLLYGPAYAGAATLLYLLAADVLVSGNVQVLCQAFMSLGRPGVVAVVQALGVGLSVALMVFLIPAYGVIGAGMALISSSVFRLIATLLCFQLFLKRPAPAMWFTVDDFLFLKSKLPVLGSRETVAVPIP